MKTQSTLTSTFHLIRSGFCRILVPIFLFQVYIFTNNFEFFTAIYISFFTISIRNSSGNYQDSHCIKCHVCACCTVLLYIYTHVCVHAFLNQPDLLRSQKNIKNTRLYSALDSTSVDPSEMLKIQETEQPTEFQPYSYKMVNISIELFLKSFLHCNAQKLKSLLNIDLTEQVEQWRLLWKHQQKDSIDDLRGKGSWEQTLRYLELLLKINFWHKPFLH